MMIKNPFILKINFNNTKENNNTPSYNLHINIYVYYFII